MNADHPRARSSSSSSLARRARGDAGGSRAAAHVLLRNALREARDLRAPIGARGSARAAPANRPRGCAGKSLSAAGSPAVRRRAADPLRCRRAGPGAAGPAAAARPCRAGERHPAGARAAPGIPEPAPRPGRRDRGLARGPRDRGGARAGDRQRAERSARELRAALRHPVERRAAARGRGHGRDRHDQRRRGAAGPARRPNMPAIWSR